MADGRLLREIGKSSYLGNGLIGRYEIWHGGSFYVFVSYIAIFVLKRDVKRQLIDSFDRLRLSNP